MEQLTRNRDSREELTNELTNEAVSLNADSLASAVESIEDAFALFDAQDRFVFCNSAYRRLLGESLHGPLVGRPYQELFDAWVSELAFADAAQRDRFRLDRLAARSTSEFLAFEARTHDGRTLRVIDRRTPEGGTVKTIRDITSDVRLSEHLQATRVAAESANAAKSEFLSSMSHELRTPLNAILGFAQLLKRDKKEPLSDRHNERVAQILKGGEHLLHLIDDILDLARIEAGGVSISTEPVSVSEVLLELRETLEPFAARTNTAIDVDDLPGDLPMVAADRTRLAQVLMNLTSNAIKYNRPGGSVRLTVSVEGSDRVRVTVIDTGMGIPLDKQDMLFQPFQRAGQELGAIEGTGIGLMITKRLAEMMHGHIGFRSVPGEGSQFWVELPVAIAKGPLPVIRPVIEAPRRARVDRKLVLYVEDNPANVTFMKDLLDNFDPIRLITAPTAEMGIELARARPPALIIMDINLPGMSGMDALQALRTFPETAHVPVIALTAAASERERRHGEQTGFYRYLTKPVNVDELEAALESALALDHRSSAIAQTAALQPAAD